MKVIMLIPCLMLDNNRDANKKCLQLAKDTYPVDEFVVYDQEFKDDDYLDGFTYIGHQSERQGFIEPRNALLRYFYKSDADYAIWMDANEFISKTSMNDFTTLIDYLKHNNDIDVIMTSMGIQIDAERMKLKQKDDYMDNVHLVYIQKGYCWFHFLTIKNFWKYYHQAPHIDKRCDVWKGLNEDEYFGKLLHKMYPCYCAPTVCSSKSGSKTSTWMQDSSNGYAYPEVQHDILNEWVYENTRDVILKSPKVVDVCIPRLDDEWRPMLKPYKSRSKKEKEIQLDLFDF